MSLRPRCLPDDGQPVYREKTGMKDGARSGTRVSYDLAQRGSGNDMMAVTKIAALACHEHVTSRVPDDMMTVTGHSRKRYIFTAAGVRSAQRDQRTQHGECVTAGVRAPRHDG
jgi:hypothetical protein